MDRRSRITPEEALEQRMKFVRAFNDTMITIWRERITLLGVKDTGQLLASLCDMGFTADGQFKELTISQRFLEYGIWQEYGVGKETPRGNSGDIGRKKVRKKKPWFAKKYMASLLNLRDFLGENLAEEMQAIVTNAFHDPTFRRQRPQGDPNVF